jgi:hypothetical protein
MPFGIPLSLAAKRHAIEFNLALKIFSYHGVGG